MAGTAAGENIAHEVLSVTRGVFRDVPTQVRRARFSSLQVDELREAARQSAQHLPDASASLAVDARQELDLRAGVAFTRLLTQRCVKQARQLLGARDGAGVKLLSWGPCQSPTLQFVVQRYDEVTSFERQPTYAIEATANVGAAPGGAPMALRWLPEGAATAAAATLHGAQPSAQPRPRSPGPLVTQEERQAHAVMASLHPGLRGCITSSGVEPRTVPPPEGLNTVRLLQACSKALALSPKR
eukprot:5939750-Prymnesium_polylepis.2